MSAQQPSREQNRDDQRQSIEAAWDQIDRAKAAIARSQVLLDQSSDRLGKLKAAQARVLRYQFTPRDSWTNPPGRDRNTHAAADGTAR